MKFTSNATTKFGLGFWKFFLFSILSPAKRGFSADKSQFFNGLIIFGIYSFLTGINTYSQTIISMREFGIEEIEGFNFFSSMILPFIYTAISLLIIAGIILVIALLMRSGTFYPEVVARFGALLAIPTLISFVILIFTLMNATTSILFFFISLLSMIGLFAAISFTVYSFYDEEKSGLDPFYAVLLTFIGLGFLVFIFRDSIFTGIFSYTFSSL